MATSPLQARFARTWEEELKPRRGQRKRPERTPAFCALSGPPCGFFVLNFVRPRTWPLLRFFAFFLWVGLILGSAGGVTQYLTLLQCSNGKEIR